MRTQAYNQSMTFRTKIEKEIQRRGMSMYDLARLTGIPRSTLQHYLVAGRPIGSDKLERILARLKIGPKWLQ